MNAPNRSRWNGVAMLVVLVSSVLIAYYFVTKGKLGALAIFSVVFYLVFLIRKRPYFWRVSALVFSLLVFFYSLVFFRAFEPALMKGGSGGLEIFEASLLLMLVLSTICSFCAAFVSERK